MRIRYYRVLPHFSLELPNGIRHARAGRIVQHPEGVASIDDLVRDNRHRLIELPAESSLASKAEPWWAGLWPEMVAAGYQVEQGIASVPPKAAPPARHEEQRELAPQAALVAPEQDGALRGPQEHAAVLEPGAAANRRGRGRRS